MRHLFQHPFATHSALDVLGYRRNGSPIYAIAGGSGEGEGGSGSGAPTAGDQGTPPATPPAPAPPAPPPATPETPSAGEEGTDWKAHAREWEKRAKANAKAQDELEKYRKAQMSEQEKAVTEAEERGRTAAATTYGQKLAAAEFRAAVAAAGVDLGEAAEFIDTNRFVGEDGEVDTKAIKAAVGKFSKLAPKGPGRSGADLGGGSGDQPPSVDKQIAEAKAKGDWRTAMRLENSKLPGLAAAQDQ